MHFTGDSQVWDLHIHTNQCPKGSGVFSTEYKNDTEGFINDLLEHLIINEKNRVNMISFTDHNQISGDVYTTFYSRDTSIQLIPGVEIDCITSPKNTTSKHVIVYFDCNKEDIEDLATKVNEILYNTREKNICYTITDLLTRLVETGYNFIVSPHAFKQDKRAIDFDWSDKDITEKTAPMFMDQFFVFWEASGHSTIQRAQEFLEDFELNEKISVISFSDSNNFEKIEAYISSPTQYFHSMPSFRGLALVGSDSTRIRSQAVSFDDSKNPGMIKEVSFDGEIIEFSKQLNAIIGGRGSGKSILLDSIAQKLGKSHPNKKRTDYLKKFPVRIKNYNNLEVSDNFQIDYFNQAYVNDLFIDNNFSAKLKEKFNDSFSQLTKFSKGGVGSDNMNKFLSLLTAKEPISAENMNSFLDEYPVISDDGLTLKIFAKNKIGISVKEGIIDYSKEYKKIDDYFKSLPTPIKDNTEIEFIKAIVKRGIALEIYKYNTGLLKSSLAVNKFIDDYLYIKKTKSDVSTKKASVEESIKRNVDFLLQDIRYRNSIINVYYEVARGFKSYYSEFRTEDGSERNRFIFSNELKVQTPISYLIDTFNEYISAKKMIVNESNIEQACFMYINGSISNILKETSDINMITSDLESYSLKYDQVSNIYYVDNGKIKNIIDQSPGTQTNILMEYIVYKKTSKPLLIDQPEDNIDNKTIYDKLRKWFSKLKNERQVIVVTHDANIVINSDAENVIVAEQKEVDKFTYHYGALEYDDILGDASSILDGGTDAVKRRLTKYES